MASWLYACGRVISKTGESALRTKLTIPSPWYVSKQLLELIRLTQGMVLSKGILFILGLENQLQSHPFEGTLTHSQVVRDCRGPELASPRRKLALISADRCLRFFLTSLLVDSRGREHKTRSHFSPKPILSFGSFRVDQRGCGLGCPPAV